MRVALYARYSTDLQRDASIEDQVRLCRERAAREGRDIAGVYTNHAVSGASLMRPGVPRASSAVRSAARQTPSRCRLRS